MKTSPLWEITSEGEDYLEHTGGRLEVSAVPGMRGFIVPGAQLRLRLSILHCLKDQGPTAEDSLPPFKTASDFALEKGWMKRAETLREAARKAIEWLRDRNYILNVGSA